MELVGPLLKQRLPFELYGKIQVLAHNLGPVMAELLEKHPQKIPQMIVRTKSLSYVRRLIRRYGVDVNAVCHETREFGLRQCFTVEVGYTDALHKVRVYRYLRQPRWRNEAWREIGVLV